MPLKPPGWHFKKSTLWVPVPSSLFSLLKIAVLSLLKDIKGSGSLLSLRVGQKKSKCCVSPTDTQHKGAVWKTHQQGQGSEGAPPRGERADEQHFPSLLSAQLVELAGTSSQTLRLPCWQLSHTEVLPCAPTPPNLLCPAVVWFCWLTCREWMTLSLAFPTSPSPMGQTLLGANSKL